MILQYHLKKGAKNKENSKMLLLFMGSCVIISSAIPGCKEIRRPCSPFFAAEEFVRGRGARLCVFG